MTTAHTGSRVAAETLADAVAALRARGLRLSGARRLVLEALYATDRPLAAEEIADGVDGAPASDLASVYRNLETLERLGLVRHVHLGHGAGRYVRSGREREYVVCERCGANLALEPARLDGVRAAVEDATGFHARFSHFPIVGLCRECAAADPAAATPLPGGAGEAASPGSG
jgi:Fur family ferric uptake transcriptional regulator